MALLALWNPNIQFLKTDGTINAGGKLVVTDHNDAESVPANYSDADGTTLNTSPIILDALGRATCYIDGRSTYDLYVKDADGATLWTVPEMTPGAETIVVRAGFSVSSNDSSVSVVISVDPNGVTNYDLSIQDEIDRAKEAEKGLSDSIEAEKKRAEAAEIAISKSIADETERATEAEKGLADAIEAEKNRAEESERTLSESISKETERAIAAEKASRTEIVAGDNITVDKTTGEDGHDIYTINGEKGGVEGVYGVYSRLGGAWHKTSGDADITALTAGNYHYTLIVGYSVGTTSNTIATIDSGVGAVMHRAPVDCSFGHTGFVEFSGDYYGTALNPTLVFPTGVSLYPDAYLFVHSTAGGGSGGGSGDADIVVFKVSYSISVAAYVYPTYQEVANAVSAGKMPVILRYAHNSPVQHCFVFRWLSEDYIHFDNGSQYVEISNGDAVKTGYVNDKNLAADYDPTATYDIGDYCVYHNELFVCTTDILVAEEWNGSHWRRTSMSDIVGNVETLLAAL